VGFAALACACERATPAACAATVPKAIARRLARSCGLVTHAAAVPGRARRLVTRAGALFGRASRLAGGGKGISDPACARALEAMLHDDAERARLVRDSL
jgi:hypothetical protein